MYTSDQITQMLKVSQPTLGRYVKDFGDFLSPSARKPRGRRFTTEDLKILSAIKELYSSKKRRSEIQAELQVFLMSGGSDDTSYALAMFPEIVKRFDDIERALKHDVVPRDEFNDFKRSRSEEFDEFKDSRQRTNRNIVIVIIVMFIIFACSFIWLASQIPQ